MGGSARFAQRPQFYIFLRPFPKVISTQHGGEMENVTRKRKDGPGREVVQKPSAVVDYNR